MTTSSSGTNTPRGTQPMPTRRRTKHKRPSYGLELMQKAAERRKRRAERAETANKP